MARQLSQREQKILIITLGLAFVYLSYNGIIKPLKERIETVDNQITVSQKRIAKNQRIVRKAKARDTQFQYYVNRFRQDKPNEELMSSMVSNIEKAAGDLGLRISDMKPNKVKTQEIYNLFSVSLKIDSSLKDIVHFLYVVQNSPYSFEVENIRFDKGSRKKSQTLKARIVLSKIYVP